MKMFFAIKDVLAGTFMTPFMEHNENSAKRLFITTVNDQQNAIIYNNPQDYQLVKVATWDSLTGEMVKDYKVICDAVSVKKEA